MKSILSHPLVQWSILLTLIAVVLIGNFTLLGGQSYEVFSQINSGLTIDSPYTTTSVPSHIQEHRAQPVEVNPMEDASVDNLSTFALDVDTASYTSARNYITNGSWPYKQEVRIEEFVNYFDYTYPEPTDNKALGISVDSAPAPWASTATTSTHIVRVGIKGKQIDDSERKDASLVFVIDVSGSMDVPNRLPLVKEAMTLLVDHLRDTDQVGIVIYGNEPYVVLEPTSAINRDTIKQAISSLRSNGSTNAEGGLRLGYDMAANHFKTGAINRVILCSDGVANVGATGPDDIRAIIRDYTAQGVTLSTIGFGMGDYNDVMMEQLADDGNGNYSYVDTIDEAERIFVENLTGLLQVIAKDAKAQVEFNPQVVARYRLLGYENRAIADEDFRNDKVDAGEIGAGHTATALYEVELTEDVSTGTALTVQVRYQDLDTHEVVEVEHPFAIDDFGDDFNAASAEYHLAVAVAVFADQLRGSEYTNASMDEVVALAQQAESELANNDEVQEFASLVEQASNLPPREPLGAEEQYREE